ncbi:hypothetical protein RRG08_029290 [Elysia crispata]|uniref:Integrase catalytic domain-containing protein n=1 Tax=Elysia crispata TaxID=231223 RepID=A0AAE1A6M3_9GAST|nr:hypothetical protein RRG08_029290 [Elysia crispata]
MAFVKQKQRPVPKKENPCPTTAGNFCCHRCQAAKKPGVGVHQPPGHLATAPLEVVAMDFTKLEVSADGKEDVLVLTDVFTK